MRYDEIVIDSEYSSVFLPIPENILCPYCGMTYEKDSVGHLTDFTTTEGKRFETCWNVYVEWLSKNIPAGKWVE